jgi:hypothetical protein
MRIYPFAHAFRAEYEVYTKHGAADVQRSQGRGTQRGTQRGPQREGGWGGLLKFQSRTPEGLRPTCI